MQDEEKCQTKGRRTKMSYRVTAKEERLAITKEEIERQGKLEAITSWIKRVISTN
jgi:hypothetical protein